MPKIWKSLLIQLCAVGVLVLGGRRVAAADLLVSPVNTYLRIDGGEEKFIDFSLVNQENYDVDVTLTAKSFRPDTLNGTPQLLETLEFPFVSLTQDGAETERVHIPAQGEVSVQVKVAPPLGVPMKEYPLTLLFVAMGSEPSVSSGSSLGMQVGSNLIVRLDDSNEDKSNLTLTLAPGPRVLEDTFLRPRVQALVTNLGPFGTLINGGMRLLQGEREVATWEFYPDLVLGESSRLARASDGSLDGNGNISLSSQVSLPRFLLGYYTLETYVHSINAPDGIQTVSQVHFLALPYWLMLLLTLIGIVLAVVKKATGGKHESRKRLDAQLARMKKQRQYFG